MKMPRIKCHLITAASVLCLGASAMAGPGPRPMYMMINGAMYQVTAFTGDVTLDNGCKICTNGTIVFQRERQPNSMMETWFRRLG